MCSLREVSDAVMLYERLGVTVEVEVTSSRRLRAASVTPPSMLAARVRLSGVVAVAFSESAVPVAPSAA